MYAICDDYYGVMVICCDYCGLSGIIRHAYQRLNWEDAYPVARTCDLIDVYIGAGDTFRLIGCLMCVGCLYLV